MTFIPPSIHTKIGCIGELYAEILLKRMGFKVCQFAGDDHIGSTIYQGKKLKDFDCLQIYELTKHCFMYVVCGIPNRPCKDTKSEFFRFSRMNLEQFNKDAWLGNRKFCFQCEKHLVYTVRIGKCPPCERHNCYLPAYLFIDNYIRQYNSALKYLANNSKRFPNSRIGTGAPGRIDYIAIKDGIYHFIEVKVNNSRPSLWQVIRLQWMKEHGHQSFIMRIYFNNNDLKLFDKLFEQKLYNNLIKLLKAEYKLEPFGISNYPNYLEYYPNQDEIKYFGSIDGWWEDVKARRNKVRL